jgi:hypothetical protein
LLKHWSGAVHEPPAAARATHAPASQYVILGDWHASSKVHDGWQITPLESHARPLGQEAGLLPMQAPLPSQRGAAVNSPLKHDERPQVVPAMDFSHVPPTAQLPVLPHGGTWLHCPGGAEVPARNWAHVPSATPVCALVQPMHVPVHAWSQQTPSEQKPVEHWLAPVHGDPPAFEGVQMPPFFVSQKLPAWQSVSIAHAVHVIALQSPLAQSFATLHFLEFAHGAQSLPPQSTSVSSASCTPSVQCIATHVPLPSHTTPLLSVQAVPFAALLVPHVRAVPSHVLTLQSVVGIGQSVGATHATQVPLPSHTLPPLSVHAVPAFAFMVLQQPARHALVTHAVVGTAQSDGAMHALSPSQVFMAPAPAEGEVAPPPPPRDEGGVAPPPQPDALARSAVIVRRRRVAKRLAVLLMVARHVAHAGAENALVARGARAPESCFGTQAIARH